VVTNTCCQRCGEPGIEGEDCALCGEPLSFSTPSTVAGWVEQADRAAAADMPIRAERCFREALALDPWSEPALQGLAALAGEGAIERRPGPPPALLMPSEPARLVDSRARPDDWPRAWEHRRPPPGRPGPELATLAHDRGAEGRYAIGLPRLLESRGLLATGDILIENWCVSVFDILSEDPSWSAGRFLVSGVLASVITSTGHAFVARYAPAGRAIDGASLTPEELQAWCALVAHGRLRCVSLAASGPFSEALERTVSLCNRRIQRAAPWPDRRVSLVTVGEG
jgi:hypothetical protein